MRTPRLTAALLLAAALGAACAPLRLAPTTLSDLPQGASFLADPAPKLPIGLAPLRLLPDPEPSLTGGARCGSEPGEQARAQCLRGGRLELGPTAD